MSRKIIRNKSRRIHIGVVPKKARFINKYEDDFSDGVFAISSSEKIKVRALLDHCKKIGKEISELSPEELVLFISRGSEVGTKAES